MTDQPASDAANFAELASQISTSAAFMSRLLGRVAGQGRSVTAWRVLSTLDRHGAQRVGDLAGHERIAQPTMTGLVGRLEREGLVTRSADPQDRRAALVEITGQGQAALQGYRAHATAALSQALGQMSQAELDTLRQAQQLYTRVVASLESQLS